MSYLQPSGSHYKYRVQRMRNPMRPQLKIFAWTMFGAQAVAWTILLGWLHNVTWAGLFLLGPFVGLLIGLWFSTRART